MSTKPTPETYAATKTSPPSDARPYQHHLGETQRITHTETHRQIWLQVGWWGQTGALYSLTEDPSKHEPGSFSPLWVLVDNDERVDDGESLTAEVERLRARNKSLRKDVEFWQDQQKLAANVAATIADLDEEAPALRKMLRTEKERRRTAESEMDRLQAEINKLREISVTA